jgi:hypothetical protein
MIGKTLDSNYILKQLSAWFPVVVWAAVIFKLSNGSVPMASKDFWLDFVFKKSAHMFFFGIFSIFSYRALRMNKVDKKKSALLAITAALIYGISDEIHQSFTQGREARIRDVGFDTIGGSIAIMITYYVLPKLPKQMHVYLNKLDLI